MSTSARTIFFNLLLYEHCDNTLTNLIDIDFIICLVFHELGHSVGKRFAFDSRDVNTVKPQFCQ